MCAKSGWTLSHSPLTVPPWPLRPREELAQIHLSYQAPLACPVLSFVARTLANISTWRWERVRLIQPLWHSPLPPHRQQPELGKSRQLKSLAVPATKLLMVAFKTTSAWLVVSRPSTFWSPQPNLIFCLKSNFFRKTINSCRHWIETFDFSAIKSASDLRWDTAAFNTVSALMTILSHLMLPMLPLKLTRIVLKIMSASMEFKPHATKDLMPLCIPVFVEPSSMSKTLKPMPWLLFVVRYFLFDPEIHNFSLPMYRLCRLHCSFHCWDLHWQWWWWNWQHSKRNLFWIHANPLCQQLEKLKSNQ